jgi:hypothetical protein
VRARKNLGITLQAFLDMGQSHTKLPVDTEHRPRYWTEFLKSARSANDFLEPMVLRRYQSEILNRGEFRVVSPFSSDLVACECSVVVFRGQTAYFFRGPNPFWLLVQHGSISYGYPLAEVVLELEGEAQRIHLWRKSHPRAVITMTEIDHLLAISNEAIDRSERQRAALIVGHENFAHHIWNELSALDLWLATASEEVVARTPLLVTSEPLGPLHRLFPRLAAMRGRNCQRAIQAVPLRVRVGGQRVTSRVREILRAKIQERARPLGREAYFDKLAMRSPRVWISVRQGSRTPDNQADFLFAVISTLLHEYPDAAFVLDGFSFPVGFFNDPMKLSVRKLFLKRASDDHKFITTLRRRIEASYGAEMRSRFFSTEGLDVLDAMSVAGLCTFYVCHAGTLQHKIGWVHDIPGIVHTSPDDHRYALWCSNFVEGAILPEFVPAELCVSTSPPMHKQNIPRNYNYLITDVERAAQSVVDAMKINGETFRRGTGLPLVAAERSVDSPVTQRST